MIQGLYSGAAALDVLAKQQEATSANLANLNSAGHRASRFAVIQRKNDDGVPSNLQLGPEVSEARIDFSQGRLQETGRSLDVAISGDGFFVLDGAEENLYTRNGRFFRSPESGMLVNDDGIPALGVDGTITIGDDVGDHQIEIASDGTIAANGETIGQLKVVAFQDNSKLNPLSHSVFATTEDAEIVDSNASVTQFHQEHSNANSVTELISLIVGSRHYEAIQKVTRTISESLKEHIRT